jgi:hypothetical protein
VLVLHHELPCLGRLSGSVGCPPGALP